MITTLPRYSGIVDRIYRMLRSPLGAARQVASPLGAGRASGAVAVSWWLSGGISASDVAGVWQPKGAASLAASYLRLAGDQGYADIDPAVVGGVAPTLGANGWTFNGSTQYLITGIIPPAGYAAIVRVANVANSGAAFGASAFPATNTWFGVRPARNGSIVQYWHGTVVNNVSGAVTNGSVGIAALSGYKNGVFDIATGAWSGSTNKAVWIGAASTDPAVYIYAGDISAIAFYKTTITPAQFLAVHTAMMAL